MTAADYKKHIQDKYHAGQEIDIYLKPEEKKAAVPVKIKIIAFYDNYILTERKGFRECYSYYEFERVSRAAARAAGDEFYIIPDALVKRRWSASHHKKKKHY